MAKKKWTECQVQGCFKGGTLQRYKQNVYEVFPNGYCPMHNARYKRHGSPESYHPNLARRPAIIDGDIAKIPLGRNAKDGYAIVDSDMAYLADEQLWNLDSLGYPVGSRRSSDRLHKTVVGKVDKGKVVDHINRNKLDNRRINLRVCTQSQNSVNTTLQKHYKNKYKGVYKHKNSSRFYIRYKTDKGLVYKGGFSTEEAAAAFYNKKQSEYFGEYITLSAVRS